MVGWVVSDRRGLCGGLVARHASRRILEGVIEMKRRTKWIVWALVVGTLLAIKLVWVPSDEVLYERLNEYYN